jgi:hypothetical protein
MNRWIWLVLFVVTAALAGVAFRSNSKVVGPSSKKESGQPLDDALSKETTANEDYSAGLQKTKQPHPNELAEDLPSSKGPLDIEPVTPVPSTPPGGPRGNMDSDGMEAANANRYSAPPPAPPSIPPNSFAPSVDNRPDPMQAPNSAANYNDNNRDSFANEPVVPPPSQFPQNFDSFDGDAEAPPLPPSPSLDENGMVPAAPQPLGADDGYVPTTPPPEDY